MNKLKTNNMVKIISKSEYTSVIQFEIDNRLLKTSEYIVSEWNSKHTYEDRIELSDVFDYVFEKSDLEGYEDYIVEHFKKVING
jgi:hypothetical protein